MGGYFICSNLIIYNTMHELKEIIHKLKESANSLCYNGTPNTNVKIGQVVSVILTDKGRMYSGVSIETLCSIGFCAEHSAIAEMLKNGESRIEYIIAFTNNTIITPCGRCRELIRLIDPNNINNTKVIISEEKAIFLSELLPMPFIIKEQGLSWGV